MITVIAKKVVNSDSYKNFDDYSEARGKKEEKSDDKPKKLGYFSKEKKDARKEKRSEKKEERKEKRAERRADRKAKRGARPLKTIFKNGVKKFKDALPKLKKKVNSGGAETFVKTLPDGTVKELTKEMVKVIPASKTGGEQSIYDLADINTSKEVLQTVNPDGSIDLHKEYSESETETIPDEIGTEQVYKKEDVEDTEGTMNKNLKIGLIVGGVLLLATGIFIAVRMSSKTKTQK